MARGPASLQVFDTLPAPVRAALRETCFEMDPREFAEMTEADALRWIASIDREVRAADDREKR